MNDFNVLPKGGYDALSPVCDFNTIAGVDCKWRYVDDTLLGMQMNILEEEFDETKEAYLGDDRQEVIDGACDLIVVAAGLLHRLGVEPNIAMQAVNQSNASKFCYNEHDANMSVAAYSSDTRYKNVHWQLVQGVYVIRGKKVGGTGWKILKGINYKAPDLSGM